MKKLLIAAFLIGFGAWAQAARITDTHELTDLGSGVYQKNFNDGNDWRGFVTGDNSVLNRKWYVRYKIQFHTNWNWGSSTYDGSSAYLSNCKILRLWNPGDVQENVVIALMGWENNAMLSVENIGDQNFRFLSGFKNILKAGSTHVWEFEFLDSDVGQSNGYMKVWLNGNQVLNQGGLMTRKASSALKRPYNGGGIENVWTKSPFYGDNTMTLSEVVMAEGKTRAEYLGAVPPVPQPTVTPTTTPSATPTPAPDPGIMPQWFIDWIAKLQAFLKASVQ